jgi:CelD/BcsL family acetyltransferase involved in cellulose biosynthesis
MDCTITDETFDWFASFWESHHNDLRWDTLFVLPPWLSVWQQSFAPEIHPSFLVAREDESVIGIAPLLISEGKASIIGNPDVCDYADFITAPDKESVFCTALLNALKQKGVSLLDLGSVRPDSVVMSAMVETARQLGHEVSCQEEDISLELDLPPTWEEYLQLLNSKQRHEVRRKLRRLEETGSVNYRFISDVESVPGFMNTFLDLFSESREDKAAFMTGEMEEFFRAMMTAMSRAGLLRSGILELDDTPVAAIIAFDFNDNAYLYNSALTSEHRSLSVGVLSKVLCIKDSIERGKKKFDFLKGDERYKYHLGGQEVRLYRCRIVIG